MPSLPERKVGIVACSGEELAEGTVTRLAALKVLHELRRGQTVTICLPLFLAGGEGDRAFARFHPTITVDGCDLRCAAKGTELYSGKPAAAVVVTDLLSAAGLPMPQGRRCLNEAGKQAVDLTADRLSQLVDQLLERRPMTSERAEPVPAPSEGSPVVMCSCGSGIPVTRVRIEDRSVEVLALPLIFRQFRDAGGSIEESGWVNKLMEIVKIYNDVPTEAEASYREAILHEYEAFCASEGAR